MKVPTAKMILDAIRTEHLPQAACVSAEVVIARCAPTPSNARGRLTWNALKWSDDACIEAVRPLQNVLAKIEKERPKAVRLELYVSFVEHSGCMSVCPVKILLDLDAEGRATLSSCTAWQPETNARVPYTTVVCS